MDDNIAQSESQSQDCKNSGAAPCYANVDELRKAAKCVFLATDAPVAQDLADKLNGAANMIDELQDFAIWMTGCGYDFCQHDHFCKKRDD